MTETKRTQKLKIGIVRDHSSPMSHSYDDVRDFELSVLEDPSVEEIMGSRRRSLMLAGSKKILDGVASIRNGNIKGVFWRREKKYDFRFSILLGPTMLRCPEFLSGGSKAAYLFDALEPWVCDAQIARFVLRSGIAHLFVTAPEIEERLRARSLGCTVDYVPEGCFPERYLFAPYERKSIDIIEFGRKLKSYHDTIKTTYTEGMRVHSYNFIPDRSLFLSTLANSKVSICFPRSMTDSRVKIDLVTMRYYQSMASKCLIVGHAPKELVRLFGYNPVIEADLKDPVGQMEEILTKYKSYEPLIEKNHKTLLTNHTYQHRWQQIRHVMEGYGLGNAVSG